MMVDNSEEETEGVDDDDGVDAMRRKVERCSGLAQSSRNKRAMWQ